MQRVLVGLCACIQGLLLAGGGVAAVQDVSAPVLRGEWMVAATGAQVLAAAAEVVRALGARVARQDQAARMELSRGVGGVVLLDGEVTEHGTLVAVTRVSGVEDPNLVAAALGAATLWRFSAARVDGCAVRRQVTIEMSFALRRP